MSNKCHTVGPGWRTHTHKITTMIYCALCERITLINQIMSSNPVHLNLFSTQQNTESYEMIKTVRVFESQRHQMGFFLKRGLSLTGSVLQCSKQKRQEFSYFSTMFILLCRNNIKLLIFKTGISWMKLYLHMGRLCISLKVAGSITIGGQRRTTLLINDTQKLQLSTLLLERRIKQLR